MVKDRPYLQKEEKKWSWRVGWWISHISCDCHSINGIIGGLGRKVFVVQFHDFFAPINMIYFIWFAILLHPPLWSVADQKVHWRKPWNCQSPALGIVSLWTIAEKKAITREITNVTDRPHDLQSATTACGSSCWNDVMEECVALQAAILSLTRCVIGFVLLGHAVNFRT